MTPLTLTPTNSPLEASSSPYEAPLTEANPVRRDNPFWAPLVTVLDALAPAGHFAIAYSGGFDSRFLAYCATHLGFSVTLWHIRGPHIPAAETHAAVSAAQTLGLTVNVLDVDPTALGDFVAAQRDRCYVCKTAVFRRLLAEVNEPIADGTNHSDLRKFRPGERALRELDVFSPWAKAGFEKPFMRAIARTVGFPNPDQPSRPCLMTRFPYGVQPTAEQLQLAADVEAWLMAHEPSLPARCRFPDGVHAIVHLERAAVEARAQALQLSPEAFLAQLSTSYMRKKRRTLPFTVQTTLSGFYDRAPYV